jgi:formylglycine-generating enzyme required for sulfatase activity
VVSDARTLWMAPVQRPYWAERVWQNHSGMHAELEAAAGGIRFYWDSEPDDAAIARPDAQRVRARWTVSGTVDWADNVWVDAWGVAADFHVGGVRFVLRWIPRGRFWMGSPEDEPGRWSDEGPRHQVVLTRGYWMGETPVTQAQWKAVVRAGPEKPGFWGRLLGRSAEGLPAAPSRFQGHPHRPVEQVSWAQCESWLNLLTRARSGPLEFLLPTEAQWERACRAGTDGAFGDGSPCMVPEGNDPALDRMGWFASNSQGGTHPVGEKVPNGWGLCDMHGNVWEWCADGERPYADGAVRDPLGPAGDASRVVRGGSWRDRAWWCRSAFRFGWPRDSRGLNLGFRLLAGLKAGAAEPPGAERPGAPEGRSRGGAAGGRDAGPFVAA